MSHRITSRLFLLVAAMGIAVDARAQAPVLGAPLVPATAPAAAPNADLEQRVRELESLVRSLQAQVAVQPAAFSTQAPTPIALPVEQPSESTMAAAPDRTTDRTNAGSGSTGPMGGANTSGSSPRARPSNEENYGLPEGQVAGWNNGFFVQSPDRQFILRLTGQIQTDYRGFLKAADTTDIDTFLLRRARFGIEANVYDHYEFRFLPDFAQGKTVMQDCYMNVHYWEELQFEVGKFKQPVSYEQLIQDRYIPSLERSLIDQMMPSRDIGVMVHGQNLYGNRFDYAASFCNGETNGDADTNNNTDFAYRGVVRPFAGDEMPVWARYAQIGVSGSVGRENEAFMPTPLKTPATVPWLNFTAGDRANGIRTRIVPEYSYFCGPVGFFAQYLWMEQEVVGPAAKAQLERVPFEGWVLFGSVLLTGETRTSYSEQLRPLAPFDPCHPLHNPGAWELIARVSQLRVSDEIFAAGASQLADPTKNANRATELTVGFNWYLNAWVRVQFNVEHAQFNQPVLLGATRPSGLLTGQDTVYTRFQVIF
jgi:phosphate-selective porin OprO/OprP